MASNTDGRKLFESLARGEEPPAILLIYGEESFLVVQAIRAAVRAVLPDGGDDLSLRVFDGSQVPGSTVRQELETLALFGGRRLILVRNIAGMTADNLEAILPYLDNPHQDTVLLLTDRAIDMRKRFFKGIKKSRHGLSVQFKPLYRNELGSWVQRRAKHKGLRGLGYSEAELVVALTGPGLADMESALEKIDLYRSDREVAISGNLIREVLDDTRSRSVFELTSLLGERDLSASLQTLHRMIEGGESGVGILTMILRHFRIVWRVREGRNKGLGDRELSQFSGCPPMFLSEYERDARRYSFDRLGRVIRSAFETERALKSSRLGDGILLDRLVMQICL
jgi:DNA polymerase-3 subunit delta